MWPQELLSGGLNTKYVRTHVDDLPEVEHLHHRVGVHARAQQLILQRLNNK